MTWILASFHSDVDLFLGDLSWPALYSSRKSRRKASCACLNAFDVNHSSPKRLSCTWLFPKAPLGFINSRMRFARNSSLQHSIPWWILGVHRCADVVLGADSLFPGELPWSQRRCFYGCIVRVLRPAGCADTWGSFWVYKYALLRPVLPLVCLSLSLCCLFSKLHGPEEIWAKSVGDPRPPKRLSASAS